MTPDRMSLMESHSLANVYSSSLTYTGLIWWHWEHTLFIKSIQNIPPASPMDGPVPGLGFDDIDDAWSDFTFFFCRENSIYFHWKHSKHSSGTRFWWHWWRLMWSDVSIGIPFTGQCLLRPILGSSTLAAALEGYAGCTQRRGVEEKQIVGIPSIHSACQPSLASPLNKHQPPPLWCPLCSHTTMLYSKLSTHQCNTVWVFSDQHPFDLCHNLCSWPLHWTLHGQSSVCF